jgi:hypothetical protein
MWHGRKRRTCSVKNDPMTFNDGWKKIIMARKSENKLEIPF